MLDFSAKWEDHYRRKPKCYWKHSGNPVHPHVKLTSGRHSNGFFNSRPIIGDLPLLMDAARDLAELLKLVQFPYRQLSWVVGPQTGATKLAECLAGVASNEYTRAPVGWSSPMKGEKDGEKCMLWEPGKDRPHALDEVLMCEDVVSTGGSVDLVHALLWKDSIYAMPYLAALVNRSGKEFIGGRRVIALVTADFPMWLPDECPLCKGGSEAIDKPKDNWDQLVHTA